ncbi:MAG: acetate--CoA ligase [Bacillota bacterium]|nr:acetate--CoA ligase [Bacillota bacterium]
MTESNHGDIFSDDHVKPFLPSDQFRHKSQLSDESLYGEARDDRLAFWENMAENLSWINKWDKILDDSNPPYFKWFINGKLNVSANCIDRHVENGLGDKKALVFEGEQGDTVQFTYKELLNEVSKFSNVLQELGVSKGDAVTIWMPMVPEAIIAMLACTRIGAMHSVVFGGFSPEALKDRILDSKSKVLVTADGAFRRGKIIPMLGAAEEELEQCPSIKKVVIIERTGTSYNKKENRDFLYNDLMSKASEIFTPVEMDAEDPLFILYSSGTTGKPKGIQHTTGGYLVGVNTTYRYVFDHQDDDFFWCTADIGWITGHSYIVYGPLSNGTTTFIYEGTPDYPARDRFWELVEKYKITVFYTAPTAIRSFMRWGNHIPAGRDLSSLRLLGSVGEPINPEAWLWYHEHIGKGSCPIVDTWWQTETGMIMITPLPGVTPLKPGSATKPFPGVEADVVDDQGKPTKPGQRGFLVIKSPWPAMLRTLYEDHERYEFTYWKQYPGLYFTGDGAWKDKDGYFWIMGRVDDVLNVSGHRIGTMEVESALVDHQSVAEAAVIGKVHEIKGHAITAFVTLKEGVEGSEELVKELKSHVGKRIGAIARPEEIFFTYELPKTRSGKIMRRLLRDIAEKRDLGDVTTLMDPQVVASIKEGYTEK